MQGFSSEEWVGVQGDPLSDARVCDTSVFPMRTFENGTAFRELHLRKLHVEDKPLGAARAHDGNFSRRCVVVNHDLKNAVV